MFNKMKKSFFSKFDWAAFWVATLVTFGVYFYTLGPSVGLEDSGELATASAHLGVPHPPGYPFWTFCTWIFCKIFSFVTYMGYPNPAWAVSCCSAFFGALAAGCTAMLISRSASDFIFNKKSDSLLGGNDSKLADWFSFAGGVGGALAFAFSPVEWSQSTIVEIYSLNSLFLMLVFLLSYRWMCRPTDKTLWFAAFVFGLGLTNYQVLLFAVVPLGIIICLKNFKLFRDFALFLIPVLLTYQVLKTGELNRARADMSTDVVVKSSPVGISRLQYATLNTELRDNYWRCLFNKDDFLKAKKDLSLELAGRKNAIQQFKKEKHIVPSSIYKECLALEAELNKMSSVERNYNIVDKGTQRKLRAMNLALYLLQLHSQGFENPNVFPRFILQELGLGISDFIKRNDGKYTLTENAYGRLKKMSELTASTKSSPSIPLVIISFAVFFISLLLAFFFRRQFKCELANKVILSGGSLGAFLLLLAGTAFSSAKTWTGVDVELYAPTIEPRIYVYVGIFIMLSVAFAIVAGLRDDETIFKGKAKYYLISSAVCAVAAIVCVLINVPSADGLAEMFGYFNIENLPSYGDWRNAILKEVQLAADSSTKAALMQELNHNTNAYPSWGIFSLMIVLLFAVSSFVKKGLCYAIPVAGFQIAAFMLLSRGAMHGLAHPSTWWFWWPLVWNFAVLALVWFILPYGRSVAGAAFFTQLGVSFYAYMPIVSELRNPPMNWGYPRTWEGFKHAITRGQYEEIKMPAFNGISELLGLIKVQVAHYFSEVKIQFSDYLALLSLLPLACWRFTVRIAGQKTTVRALWVSLFFASLLAVRGILLVCGVGVSSAMQAFDRTIIFFMALPAVIGIAYILYRQLLMRPAIALLRLFNLAIQKYNRQDTAIVSSVQNLLKKLVKKSNAHGFTFDASNHTQHWILASGVCFFMMTVPLILLANVKGDIQDGFIQKVKFISSHAMIAMWIGYGLVLFGAVISIISKKALKKSKLVWVFSIVLGVLILIGSGLTPIVQNYVDEELVFKLGGSEQNNHTFGWQFGAYELDGAKAIRAQITADEEPLPDPDYPPPMEPYSIFFGGTDPGRFVPTYMIYGANFRSDIYLITQNALADGTYMAVERDLYGDEIWIPSEEDSAIAFQRYANKKGLSATNGRLQVTGALEVMEINAELAKMMHEHDRNRHAFYIEESYAMGWMYPYLSPHGLIMKINAEKTPYDSSLARKDMDFWNWYTKRLLSDPMYRRDFAAQKSFSKLRASIAGLYVRQNRIGEASEAFREAHMLYPASPEATFRYISEILMRTQKFSVISDLLEYTDLIDPNNTRTTRIKEYLNSILRVSEFENFKQDKWLESIVAAGLSDGDYYKLAVAYHELGYREKAAQIMALVENYVIKESKKDDLKNAVTVFLSVGQLEKAYNILKVYERCTDKLDMNLFVEWAILAHYYSIKDPKNFEKYREETYRYMRFAAKQDIGLVIKRLQEYLFAKDNDKAKIPDIRFLLDLVRLRTINGYREAMELFKVFVRMSPQMDRRIFEVDPILNGLMRNVVAADSASYGKARNLAPLAY